MSRDYTALILVLTPAILSYLAPTSWLVGLVFAIFWYQVGAYFARCRGPRVRNFLLGNSLTLMGLALYIFEFYIISAQGRHVLLAVLSQMYPIILLSLGGHIVRGLAALTGATLIYGKVAVVSTYLLMLGIFSLGFYKGSK